MNISRIAILTLILLAVPAMADNLALIVNTNVGVATIERADVARIFLGNKTTWANGRKIAPAMLKEGDIYQAFLRMIRKTQSKFTTYWNNNIFTGKGSPPPSFGTEQELIKFVAEHKGAIGFIDARTPHTNVAVIAVVE